MNQQPQQKSNAGIFAAVLGGLAAVGAVAAAATSGKKTKLGRAPQRLPKKPCGCSGR